jgi:hypothetical protein
VYCYVFWFLIPLKISSYHTKDARSIAIFALRRSDPLKRVVGSPIAENRLSRSLREKNLPLTVLHVRWEKVVATEDARKIFDITAKAVPARRFHFAREFQSVLANGLTAGGGRTNRLVFNRLSVEKGVKQMMA